MPRDLRPIRLRFPTGGLDRRHAYAESTPYTSSDCNNVFPFDWSTGRERGGTRPGLTATGASIGVPYDWCEVAWLDSGGTVSKRGVAVQTSTGTWVSQDGATFVNKITTTPGTDFCSCAVYQQTLLRAAYGIPTRFIALDGDGGAGTSLVSGGSGVVGAPPEDAGIVVAHNDAVWLAGSKNNPQTLYRSRQGNFKDWDTSEVDPAAAWDSSGPEGGIISRNLTAMLSHGNECLLVGTIGGTYSVLGNPKANGRTKVLSNYIGPLMQSAWCKGPDDRTYMLTGDGLFRIDSACASYPYAISFENLPAELRNINPGAGDMCAIGYDRKFKGVHIYVDYNSGGDAHFFYNIAENSTGGPPEGGFWPMSFGSTLRLAPHLDAAQTSAKSALLAINATGTVYQFDTGSSESIDSYIDYGAIKPAKDEREGIIYSMRGALSENAGSVLMSLRRGNTPTEAFSASTFFSDTLTRSGSDTQNRLMWPKMRCAAAYLRLASVSHSKIGAEELVLQIADGGRMRIT